MMVSESSTIKFSVVDKLKRRPNILWICTDQQRWDTISSLGNECIRTPNIDRLANEGVAFLKAFCQSPICTPSRSSFLTGMYPSSVHGCSNGNDRWAEAAPLVTKTLADSGYRCGLVGKLHLAGCHGRIEPRPEDDGYSVFHWSHSHKDMWPEGHSYADWVKEKGGTLGEMYQEKGYMDPELHQTKFCADKAIEFMEENAGHPWLMSVNIFDPHVPFDPPRSYLDKYDPESVPNPLFRESDLASQKKLAGVDFQVVASDPESFQAKEKIAAYYAMIEQIDDHVGRMLDCLNRSGQREDTLVIFTSDHGEMLGDHGLITKGCRFYEGLVHIPLIISWPSVISQGVRKRSLVELTDIVAKVSKENVSYLNTNVMRLLKDPLKSLVLDQRSQQIRDTCIFLTTLAEKTGDSMKGLLREIFSTILEAMKQPNKVVRGYVDDCIISLIRNVTFKYCISGIGK